ncbi:MAG: hypothetical protein KGI08_03940 [Thaumarchaeota archaeon]|nr:hypothetical protein [Nitrososphaerota archaeon]
MTIHKMNLTESELKYLQVISTDSSVTVSHLCSKTGSLASMVRRSLISLEDEGFISKNRIGLTKEIRLSASRHASIFRDMVLEHRHIPFHKYLGGSSLETLAAICFLNPKTRKEIAENSSVSEPSVARTILKLRSVGLIQKKNSSYIISPEFAILKDFIIEFRHYLNDRLARTFSRDSVILWERNDEFIIESGTKKEDETNFHPTGPSTFARFGVQLFMTVSYHHYSYRIKKITLEQAIVDSFLIPLSSRIILPVLLAWKKNETEIDKSLLVRISERYGARKFVDSIYNYFATEGKERLAELPTWQEFKSKAVEYDMKT